VSCNESQLKKGLDGKSPSLNGYEVILEDTIIFPEGGGQVTLPMVN
jgi:misacylated tRNA(Ala) deacylase